MALPRLFRLALYCFLTGAAGRLYDFSSELGVCFRLFRSGSRSKEFEFDSNEAVRVWLGNLPESLPVGPDTFDSEAHSRECPEHWHESSATRISRLEHD